MTTALKLSRGALLGAIALGGIFAGAPIVASSADAAIVGKPNFSRYCRTHYGAGSYPVYNYRFNAPACAKRGNYAVRYYRINLARACRMTYGTFGYRRYGRNTFCIGNTARRTSSLRLVTPNLAGYCRSRYGAYAQVNFSYRQGAYVCSSRYYGRYGYIHRRINMASACYFTARTTTVRYFGDRRVVRCVRRI